MTLSSKNSRLMFCHLYLLVSVLDLPVLRVVICRSNKTYASCCETSWKHWHLSAEFECFYFFNDNGLCESYDVFSQWYFNMKIGKCTPRFYFGFEVNLLWKTKMYIYLFVLVNACWFSSFQLLHYSVVSILTKWAFQLQFALLF